MQLKVPALVRVQIWFLPQRSSPQEAAGQRGAERQRRSSAEGSGGQVSRSQTTWPRAAAAVTCKVGGGGGGGGADLKLQQLWEKMDTSSVKGPVLQTFQEVNHLMKPA